MSHFLGSWNDDTIFALFEQKKTQVQLTKWCCFTKSRNQRGDGQTNYREEQESERIPRPTSHVTKHHNSRLTHSFKSSVRWKDYVFCNFIDHLLINLISKKIFSLKINRFSLSITSYNSVINILKQ